MITRRGFMGTAAAAGTGALIGGGGSDAHAAGLADLVPGAPTLVVKDLARVARYYEEGIGLVRIDAAGDTVQLGAGGRVLLTLRRREAAERDNPRLAGLYHTAFLLPSRAELGAWLRRAIAMRLPFDGVSDHKVSESLYLSDPEGNGIEVYADRPRASWRWANGVVEMGNHPLDGEGILRDGEKLAERETVPDGTVVGHVHLRVGGIPEAEAFYRDVAGLDITRKRDGATFYATSGYHHHLATNTWESAGSPPRTGDLTGLAVLALVAKDTAAFEARAERMLAAGGKREGSVVRAADPWGNLVELAKA